MNSSDIIMDMIMTPMLNRMIEVEKVVVYTTEHAKTYHKACCMTLKRSIDLITLTEEEAKARGKEPCSLCLSP